jgi:bacillolysin
MSESIHDLRWHLQRDSDFKRPTRRMWVGGGAQAGMAPGFGGRRGAGFALAGIDAEPLQEIDQELTFNTDDAAARYYLDKLLENDARPGVRALTAPGRPELLPDLKLAESFEIRSSGTRVLRYRQHLNGIPVFGTRAVVELDDDRRPRSVAAELAEVGAAPTAATISQQAVIDWLVGRFRLGSAAAAAIVPPALTYFEDKARKRWDLAWHFTEVPGPTHPRAGDHGLAPSPRSVVPHVNVLVRATAAPRILFTYGADPRIDDLPVECRGLDELDRPVRFWGRRLDGAFRLDDPQRKSTTFDLAFANMATASPPAAPITSATVDWGDTARAAISAHVNAARVLDFYESVLHRDGVDGRGMPLVSMVNCRYQPVGTDQTWRNAVWFQNRMWYGQNRDAALGRFVSFARFLDIIAHELTHGVTQSTSNLVYEGESGALNESFSDIFGVIIANWDDRSDDGGTVDGWTWEIGARLSANGLPLRDMQDPGRTGGPSHMRDFVATTRDYGGVHANSNIHNHAAHLVMTATNADATRVFTPREVAQLYYWTLERLNDRATFGEALLELIDVASSVYIGDPRLDGMLQAIRAAYADVGIMPAA